MKSQRATALSMLRGASVAIAALVMSFVTVTLVSTAAQAAPNPYTWLESEDFAWEKQDQRIHGKANSLDGEARRILEKQGLTCEGAVCRSSDGRPILDLDLSGLNLRDVTFKDLSLVGRFETNHTDLTNAKFENFRMNGTWFARSLNARGMVVEGHMNDNPDAGQGLEAHWNQVREEGLEHFRTSWDQVNAEGMKLSRLALVDSEYKRVKAGGASITHSVIENDVLFELVANGVRELPSNLLYEQFRKSGEAFSQNKKFESLEGLLPSGKYQNMNLSGSELHGSLKNVEFVDSNLKDIKVVVNERPGGANGVKTWENVTIKNGNLDNAKIDLASALNVKISAQSQNGVSINSTENTKSLQVSGVASNLKLTGNFENTNLRNLTSPEIVRAANLANIPHIASGASLANLDSTFLDLSASKQTNLLVPRNISGSKLNNTEFINTKLPDQFIANKVESEGMKFRSDAGNVMGEGPNFGRSELRNVDFSGQKFHNADFTRATLDNLDLHDAEFSGRTVFNQAKVSNLDAGNVRIEPQTKISAISSVWSSIKKFFGLGSQNSLEWGKSVIEGQLDLSQMSQSALSKIDWAGVRFGPNTEIIFKNPEVLLKNPEAVSNSVMKILNQHTTGTLQNVTLSALDENGEKIILVKGGQSAQGIADRLLDLHVSSEVANRIAEQARTALEETNPAQSRVHEAQDAVKRAEDNLGNKSDDPKLATLEKSWNSTNIELEVAQRKYDEYVSAKERQVRDSVDFIKNAQERMNESAELLDRLQDEARSLKRRISSGERGLSKELKERTREISNVSQSMKLFDYKELQPERQEYRRLLELQEDGWPSELKERVAILTANLAKAEQRLTRYSRTYNAELEKARTKVEAEKLKLSQAMEGNQKALEKVEMLNDLKETTKANHEKNLVVDHESTLTSYETALSEANRQIEEVKPQVDIAQRNLEKANETYEKAEARYQQAAEALKTMESSLLPRRNELQSSIRRDEKALKIAVETLGGEKRGLDAQIMRLTKEISQREKLLDGEDENRDSALNKEIRSQIREFQLQLKESQDRLAELQDKVETLTNSRDEALKNRQEIDEKLDKLEKRAQVLETSRDYAKESRKEATSKLKEVQNKADHLQKEVDQLISARERDRPFLQDHPLLKDAKERAQTVEAAKQARDEVLSKQRENEAKQELIRKTEQQERLRREQEAQKRERERQREDVERNNREREQASQRERQAKTGR